MKGWIAAAILAQALDATSTCAGLHRGFVEANPFLSGRSCGQIVAIKGGMTLGAVLAVRHLRGGKWAKAALFIIATSAGSAAAWNAYQITRH